MTETSARLARSSAPVLSLAVCALAALAGCAPPPLNPFTTEPGPVALVPANLAGVRDARARFRATLCAVLDARPELPDHRSCGEALTALGAEPPAAPAEIDLAPSRAGLRVLFAPGIGWSCIAGWMQETGEIGAHLESQGYAWSTLALGGLSSSARNATLIRDAVLDEARANPGAPIVVVGYSKGVADTLEAVVAYPEIRPHLAAVLGLSGAVGGSPLANVADPSDLAMLRTFPGADCPGDAGEALESLRPAVRQAWLAANPLPPEIRYYALAALPRPERMSLALAATQARLAAVDARNDGQLLAQDQLIPGGTLLGYLNADHWAAAVPIGRTRKLAAALAATQNDFPREAVLEAALRVIEQDL